MKKIKLIIAAALISILVLTGVVLSIASVIDKSKENNIPEEVPEIVEPEPIIPSEGLDKPSLPDVAPDIGREDGMPIPEAVAIDIRDKIRAMVLRGEYEDAEIYVYESISPYKVVDVPEFTLFIENIRGDLSGLAQMEYLASFDNMDGVVQIVRNLRDPYTFMAGVLWLDAYDREALFYTDESLNPYYSTLDHIGDPVKSDMELQGINEYEAIYEIPVILDGRSFKAVVIDNYGYLELYSIHAEEGVEHEFITIKEHRKMLEEYFEEDSEFAIPENLPDESRMEEGTDG